jgi:hypothetical protein
MAALDKEGVGSGELPHRWAGTQAGGMVAPLNPKATPRSRGTAWLLGWQDSLHRAEPSMAGGFLVKVEEHGEDYRRAGLG